MCDWPKYKSHKIVQAVPITEVRDGRPGEKDLPLLFVSATEAFTPTVAGMAAKANVGDYAVRYDDGYTSVSPKKAFEEGYTQI